MTRHKLKKGLYDLPVYEELREELERSELLQTVHDLDPALAAQSLTQHLTPLLRNALESAGRMSPETQIELVNQVLQLVADSVPKSGIDASDFLSFPGRRLLELQQASQDLGQNLATQRPGIPLTESDLLVNGPKELRMGSELRRELQSADRVDLLCAFLKMSGLNPILKELEGFLERSGGNLRVITTTYMGATEKRAIDALVERGAQLKISYNNQTTRLHAKAWLFHRETGFSTCYVGSSNLSHAALFDGLEWNVRVSNIDNPHILQRFETTFDQYWADGDFESYESERDGARFLEAVKRQVRDRNDALLTAIHVRPYPHQRQILDELQAVREGGLCRNLVVAATGTGKTVVAALDYKRLCEAAGRTLKLLFVAHRKEILQQSRNTFRAVMRDSSFGEYLTGELKPDSGAHVFASVFSLHENRLEDLAPDAYDIVIVDEFHHAKAPTYERLLNHLKPQFLLGLTATPERTDGKSILEWFDGRVTSEIRLWDALDRGLLAPFQYYGVADTTDLGSVTFRRGQYDPAELESVITGDHMRIRRILEALVRYTSNPKDMRAIGFCVGVKHAAMMAQQFKKAGLPAVAVAGSPPKTNGQIDAPFVDRQEAIKQLKSGEICCIFSVDLFNEGVDIPTVDTALFLRPTSSAIVFLQQLGRGLRHAPGKSHLTVLDFIGNASKHYRFDTKYKALIGGTSAQIGRDIENGFPSLPPGCDIILEKQAQEYVLQNIKQSVSSNVGHFAHELASLEHEVGEVTLGTYLEALELNLRDFYCRRGASWTQVKRKAGSDWPEGDDSESPYLRAMASLAHVDDWSRIRVWSTWLEQPTPPKAAPLESELGRFQLMLLGTIYDRKLAITQMDAALKSLWSQDAVVSELQELLAVQKAQMKNLTTDLEIPGVPIRVHGTYTLAEVMAGFNITKKGALYAPREGVLWDAASNTDIFFITLNKSESEYSPSTLYHDYPISEKRFHWESQSQTKQSSKTGQRYINHEERGSNVVLFVRRYKKLRGISQPYLCLGRATYVSHQSERPMQIVWHLDKPMPAAFYQLAKSAAG